MVERMIIVKERINRVSRIHWRTRLVDVTLFFRVGSGGSSMDVTVTFVSLLGLDLAKLNLRFFLESASLATDVGGGGKYSGWFVAELVDIMTLLCCLVCYVVDGCPR